MVPKNGLPANWEAETNSNGSTGPTTRAGSPLCLELMVSLELPIQSTEQIGLRPGRGWTDIQQGTALVVLKLGGTGHQPMNVFWFECRQMLFWAHRDGNCPAARRVQGVVEEWLEYPLPDEVEGLRVCSNTAGHETDFIEVRSDGDLGLGERVEGYLVERIDPAERPAPHMKRGPRVATACPRDQLATSVRLRYQ